MRKLPLHEEKGAQSLELLLVKLLFPNSFLVKNGPNN